MIDAEGAIRCNKCHKRLPLEKLEGRVIAYCRHCQTFTEVISAPQLTGGARMEEMEQPTNQQIMEAITHLDSMPVPTEHRKLAVLGEDGDVVILSS